RPGSSKQCRLRERMATREGIEGGRRGRIKCTDFARVIVIKDFARLGRVIVKRQRQPRRTGKTAEHFAEEITPFRRITLGEPVDVVGEWRDRREFGMKSVACRLV